MVQRTMTQRVVALIKVFALVFALALPIFAPSGKALAAPEDGTGKKQSTEESGGDSTDGNFDIDVTMGEDGKLVIDGLKNSDGGSTWNTIFQKYKVVILGISGILTLTFTLLLGKNITNGLKRVCKIRLL